MFRFLSIEPSKRVYYLISRSLMMLVVVGFSVVLAVSIVRGYPAVWFFLVAALAFSADQAFKRLDKRYMHGRHLQ